MGRKKQLLTGVSAAALFVAAIISPLSLQASGADNFSEELSAQLLADQPFLKITPDTPAVPKPDWYNKATITYTISKNGPVADLAEFSTLANATLNDPRGWSRLNVQFKQVASGGDFNLILSQPSALPSYSSGCSVDWSCRAGNNVVINNDRWTGASTAWNSGGGSLRDYRHMVVNHEVGHWLGHDHASCGGAGKSAPLMQQQSIDLMGCTFNPWPLSGELYSSRL